MTLRLTKPVIIKPVRVETPQCCVEVVLPSNEAWRLDRYKRLRPDYNPDCCQKPSTIEIDGKPYCRAHAGALALKMWITGDLMESK